MGDVKWWHHLRDPGFWDADLIASVVGAAVMVVLLIGLLARWWNGFWVPVVMLIVLGFQGRLFLKAMKTLWRLQGRQDALAEMLAVFRQVGLSLEPDNDDDAEPQK